MAGPAAHTRGRHHAGPTDPAGGTSTAQTWSENTANKLDKNQIIREDILLNLNVVSNLSGSDCSLLLSRVAKDRSSTALCPLSVSF